MSSSWAGDDLQGELTTSSLRLMEEDAQKSLLFKAIRACELHAIRTILQANRNLLNSKMHGYEGTDVFEVIKNSKTKRCYTYTGQEKDGHFYPLHVATESGHKNLAILLVKAGADVSLTDYRGCTAEEKCTGNALHAFYELRGLKYEARERYQGKTDRNGRRHGQGIVYYKPEGYLHEEKQLYRGSFKNNVYHGHGTLYFPGTETIAYIGRFKDGVRHGRGIEFDIQGNKVYQGTFRDDKREGRGEEFDEQGNKIYRGEWSNNMRHGFGVAYFSEGSKYFGRYENNLMSGIGIYCHPNNDRFEGMFFNNKPDGLGSFYEKDNTTGQWIGHHAVWQVGRKVKENNGPFIPTMADLPDDSTKHMFAEIMNRHTDPTEDNDELASQSGKESTEGPAHRPTKAGKRNSFSYFDGEGREVCAKSDWWKIQLGKYLKLSLKEAKSLGIDVPASALENLDCKTVHDDSEHQDNDANEEEQEEEEDDLDEVIGYHFMECTTLFVAYIYVNSAAKVFEDRLVNKGLTAEFPDFEAVYHLVIDAVDTYNELWEEAYREQHQQQAVGDDRRLQRDGNNQNIETRRMMFMTEKEKKEELILRQRAELAIKKGTAELDEEIEREIEKEVLASLESELTKLLVEEMEEKVHANLPISRKSNLAAEHNKIHSDNASKLDSKSKRPSVITKDKKDANKQNAEINIEDLFDLEKLDNPAYSPLGNDENQSNVEEDELANGGGGSNEFAAELLYIMRSSMSLS